MRKDKSSPGGTQLLLFPSHPFSAHFATDPKPCLCFHRQPAYGSEGIPLLCDECRWIWYRWTPPERGEAARGKRLKSESETLPPWEAKRPPWELKRVDDLEESDMSMYDDHPVPFAMSHKRFLYKNKAMIQQEEVIAQYKERSRNLGPYDAIPVPPKLGLCGGVRPCPITDDVRPRLIRFCNLALEKYNADNQGANFVFDDLVKSTSAAVTGRLYYITFNAKDAARPSSNTTALTFQAKVWDKMRPKDAEPEVMECSMKPT